MLIVSSFSYAWIPVIAAGHYLFLLYLFLFVWFIANSCWEGFVGLFAGACVWECKSRYIISLSSIWRDDSHMQCWGVSVCVWPLHSGHLPLWWRWWLRGLVWWVGLLWGTFSLSSNNFFWFGDASFLSLLTIIRINSHLSAHFSILIIEITYFVNKSKCIIVSIYITN